MTTKTVGFAIEEGDEARLERLVAKYGRGNRSAFLRAALDYMEAADRAERLRELQRYGAARTAERGPGYDNVHTVVARVLKRRK